MKKYQFPKTLAFRFYIRKPKGRRVSFGVSKQYNSVNGVTKVEAVKHPTLTAINENLRTNKIDIETAEREVEFLIEDLYRKAGAMVFKPVSNNDNTKRLNEFWEAEYTHRDIVDPNSSKHLFRRAIEALGEVSIMSGSQEAIQSALDRSFESNVHGRMVGCIKTLLRWLGRHDVRLRKKRQPRTQPLYVTEQELNKILLHIESKPFKLMSQMAFYSGCRIGELFALNHFSLKNDGSIYVAGQIKDNGDKTEPKSGSEGSAFLFRRGRELFDDWLSAKNSITSAQRVKAAQIFRTACRKAFPNSKDKWLRFHDLRHSYAIALLGMGASLTDVAQSLRNDIRVCQRFYAGFLLNQTRMLGLLALESKTEN